MPSQPVTNLSVNKGRAYCVSPGKIISPTTCTHVQVSFSARRSVDTSVSVSSFTLCPSFVLSILESLYRPLHLSFVLSKLESPYRPLHLSFVLSILESSYRPLHLSFVLSIKCQCLRIVRIRLIFLMMLAFWLESPCLFIFLSIANAFWFVLSPFRCRSRLSDAISSGWNRLVCSHGSVS